MSEHAGFQKKADAVFSGLRRDLSGAADDYGFKVSVAGGAIAVDCGSPGGRFSVTANPAAEQIVLQLPSKTYKLDWDVVEAAFVHTESGQTLRELIEQTLSKHLREEVSL